MKRQALALAVAILIVIPSVPSLKADTRWISPPLGLAKGSDCPECDAGEWRLVISRNVDVGDYVYVPDPPCDDEAIGEQRRELGRALADYAEPGLGEAAGPFIDALTDTANNYFKANVRGTVGEYLSAYTTPTAECQILAGIVPKDADVTGVKYWAADGVDPEERTCDPGDDGNLNCGIGWSKFYPAYTEAQAGGKAVCAVFSNWSDDRERTATIAIYFRPLPGKAPIPIHR
jgi:hypothetical protein